MTWNQTSLSALLVAEGKVGLSDISAVDRNFRGILDTFGFCWFD